MDIWSIVAALYFVTVLYFVIVPLLGLISGLLAGWLMRGISIGFGAIVGLGTGLLVLVAFELLSWATGDLFLLGPSRNLLLLVAFSPPVLALAVPVVVLQVIGIRRGRGN